MSYLRFKLPKAIFEKLKAILLEDVGYDKFEVLEKSKRNLCKEISQKKYLKGYYDNNKKRVPQRGGKFTISEINLYRAFFDYGRGKYDGAVLSLADWICRYITDDLKMDFLQYQGLSSQTELAQYLAPFYEKVVIDEDENVYEKQYPEKKKKVEVVVEKTADLPKFITSIHSPPEKFVGREVEIAALQKRLENESLPLLVSGMGGIGKTSIVAKWFAEYLDEYDHIMWIDCLTSLPQAFVNSLETKELPNDWKLKEKELPDIYTKRILHKILNIGGKNLLIIDGWDNETEINQFHQELNLPNWTVLITTRVQSSSLPCFTVGKLDEIIASTLFERHASQAINDPILPQLLDYIDYHTLTIELLAKTFDSTFYIESIEQLLQLLQENKWEDEDLMIDIKINHSEEYVQVYSHLLATFHLSELSEYEKWLLLQFSVLPPIPINGKELGEWLKTEKKQKNKYVNALNGLAKKGWLENLKNKNYQIHPIVQTALRYHLEPNNKNCAFLIESFTKLLYIKQRESPMSKKVYIPYVTFMLNYITQKKYNVAELLKKLALVFHDQYDSQKALFYQKKANDIYEDTLDMGNLKLASSYNLLSMIYQDLGDFQESLSYQKRAIEIMETNKESSDIELASSYNNISLIYMELEDTHKTLYFQLKAVQIFEDIHEPNHPELAILYNNLSSIYLKMVDYDKALYFQKKSVSIIEKEFEPLHPYLAGAYNTLSLIYNESGKLEEALNYQKKAIKIKEVIFEPFNIQLGISYNNLASLYRDMDNLTKALHYQKKSVEIKEKALSLLHPGIATAYNNLAILYKELNYLDDALAYELKAINIREEVFGLKHPYVAFSFTNLSDIYCQRDDYEKAIAYINKAIEVLEDNFPKGHFRIERALKVRIKINKYIDLTQ